MWAQPSTPMAPPITVPSVQNAMVRTPLTVPAAASTPERSRSCSNSTLLSSKKMLKRSSGSRGSSDSRTVSGAITVIEISWFSVLPERERDVVPAESERVVDCVLVIAGSRTAVYDVQVDLRVEILQVQRRRDDPVLQRQNGQDGLDRADRADRVAKRRLRCGTRWLVATHCVVYRVRFGHVADRGSGRVCVDVVDVVGPQ